jgi:type I restriction enzyme S subunit
MSDAIFSFITSGSRGWAEYYSETGPIFLRIGNLDHEDIRLDLSEIQHVAPPNGAEGMRTAVQHNDILISVTADVGMVGLVPEDLGEAYINQHVALARPLSSICPSYIAYYFCSSEGGGGHLKKLQRGATKVGLTLDDIRSVPVPLPPLAEQTRIVAEVERRLSVVDELEAVVSANLQRAARLRQSILQTAFTGGL